MKTDAAAFIPSEWEKRSTKKPMRKADVSWIHLGVSKGSRRMKST
jgi:hypothetical protein